MLSVLFLFSTSYSFVRCHGGFFPLGDSFLFFLLSYSELFYSPALLLSGKNVWRALSAKEGTEKGGLELQCCLCMQNIPICFCALSWGEGSRERAPSLSLDKRRPDSCAPATKDSLFCQLCLLSAVSDLCATLVANTYAYQTILIGFLHNISPSTFFFFLHLFPNNLIDSCNIHPLGLLNNGFLPLRFPISGVKAQRCLRRTSFTFPKGWFWRDTGRQR